MPCLYRPTRASLAVAFATLLTVTGCASPTAGRFPTVNTGALGAASVRVPIDGFYQVSPGVYRGARPGAAGVDALARLGVKTVLDLESAGDEVERERAQAAELGLHFVSVPLSGFWAPDDVAIARAVAVAGDRAGYPLFIHCKHGQDRTGLVVGMHRIAAQGWSAERAYAEMIDYRFHPVLVFLDRYFKSKTGRDERASLDVGTRRDD